MPIKCYVSFTDFVMSVVEKHIDHNVQCETLAKYCNREMLQYAVVYACSQKKYKLVHRLFKDYNLDESVDMCVAIALSNKDLEMQQLLYDLYPCVDVNKVIKSIDTICS